MFSTGNKQAFASLGVMFIAALFVFSLAITDSITEDSTPLITTVLGFAGLIIMGGAATNKVARVEDKVDKVLNGEMDAKIERVLTEVLDAREAARSQDGNETA